jgi:hypothetical protein
MRQLATNTMEASTTQGHEGNVPWLKRQLREEKDTIVQLQETHRLSEERHKNNSKECEVVGKEAHEALTNAQKKQV